MVSHTKNRLIVFLTSFLIISCISIPISFAIEEIVFPTNVKEFEYIETTEFEYYYYDYKFKLSQKLIYEVLNVDVEDNSFDVKLSSIFSLISFDNVDIRRIEARWNDGENVEEFPFSIDRDFEYVVNRRVDLSTGKILKMLPDSLDAEEVHMIFTIEETDDEESYYITGLAGIGYEPYPWKYVYKPQAYSTNNTLNIKTNAGEFTCYSIIDGNWTKHYDTKSNFCIQMNFETTNEYFQIKDMRVFSKIIFGRSWDSIKIINGGVSSAESKVKETEIVWFEVAYEYDSEVFDSSKGILYMNDEPMTWSSSNQRWEKEVSSEKPQEITYKITNVQDDKYALTSINDEVGSLIIEWGSRGIPGFPYESIIISLIAVIIILWRARKFYAVMRPIQW